MTIHTQDLPLSSDPRVSGKDLGGRTSEDPLIPPPPVPLIQAAPNSSPQSSNANSGVFSTNSGRSNRSVQSSWTVGSNSSVSSSAYGDRTGTKGFGTGNAYEHSDRVNTVPGVFGGSVGTKGFGTGTHYERSPRASPRVSPAASASSLPSNTSRSSRSNLSNMSETHGSTDKKRKKLGNKLLGAAEVVAGKVTKNSGLVERGQERKSITA
ncbi:hypothetical protein AAF712_013202 [Marasmius tenuissimus]|uniref:Uncharacterized protein n=1 Tax=Marasmius tenuissimus TaxID=585030 RepID=A0ABR2ZFB0_9AGAR